MKYLNRHKVPAPLFNLLGKETYSRGSSRKSVSQLIGSPRIDILKSRHAQDIEADISDRIWALFGTAIHSLIEQGAPGSGWDIAEERIFTEVNGWQISGAIDRQLLPNGKVKLIDWKVCSIYSVLFQKPDWEYQLNSYAYLVEREKKMPISELEVCAFLRDWRRADAKRDRDYPQSPIHVVHVPLWSYARREAYVLDRVRRHQAAEMQSDLDLELPECTDDDMWTRPASWAAIKIGNKRASKVFASKEKADEFLRGKTGYTIEHRPGRRVRCEDVCEVSRWCSQYAAYNKETY